MKRNLLLTIVSFIFILSPSFVLAQMFSVGETTQQRVISNSFIRFGYGPATFEYTGNDLNPSGTEILAFDNNAFFVSLETPGVNLSLILGNELSGFDEKNYFDLSFTLSNKFALVRERSVIMGLPIQLHSSITNINNDQTEENFNQVNFGVGGGGFIDLKLGNRISFTNELVPGYGFSNSSGGFFGGSFFYVVGKSRINFNNIILGRSFSLGYDFNYRSFDIDDELYDFDLKSHLLTIGISL
ncbi:MAG: hypothetical protein RLN90_09985 [Balneolaceae bacterium]